jgi:FkbM family methyltransferase
MFEKEKNCFDAIINKLYNRKKPLIFFGAAYAGQLAYDMFGSIGIRPDYFCDNNASKHGTAFLGIPVLSFKELCEKHRDSYIFISAPDYLKDIRLMLKENNLEEIEEITWLRDKMGFYGIRGLFYQIINQNKESFDMVFKALSDDVSRQVFSDFINYRNLGNSKDLIPLESNSTQYFEKGIIKLSENEVFIDGGAYIGDTVEDFMNQTDGKFHKIYSFEPDENNYKIYNDKFIGNSDITLMPYGLWSRNDTLRFKKYEQNPGGNRITDANDSNLEVPVTSVDEVLKGKPASFIKMDIEGAELEALRGSRATIQKYRPKLAICVYHKPMDIVDIPLFIKELVPEYKLYLRHYSNSYTETVLYAIAD